MSRIALTDGMAPDAVAKLEELGHEVVTQHYSPEELIGGVLSAFDAVVVRSATKMTADEIDIDIIYLHYNKIQRLNQPTD